MHRRNHLLSTNNYQTFIVILMLSLWLSACGSEPPKPDPELVALAVRATVQSRPSPEPIIVEVTRIVEIVTEATPIPLPTAPPEPTVAPAANTVTSAENQEKQGDAAQSDIEVQGESAQREPTQNSSAQEEPIQSGDAAQPGDTGTATAQSNDLPPDEPQAEDSQPDEGQSNEGQSNEGQSNEGQSNEGQSNEGQSNEGQSNEGQAIAVQANAASAGSACPITSSREYTAIPMENADTSRPHQAHGDLNLANRSYVGTSATLQLVDMDGSTDGRAPRLNGIFTHGSMPSFTSAHKVRGWDWACGDHGCPTEPLDKFEVTLLGIQTPLGEAISIPTGSQEIFGGGYVGAVLYAEASRLTVSYTRSGSAADGYVVHLENFCTDPNLVALYQSSNQNGRNSLPGLRNGDIVGTASGGEVLVSIRDAGKFMDPRSRKDWWN